MANPNFVRAMLSRSGTFISSQRVFSRVSSASSFWSSFSFFPISREIDEQREFMLKKIISMMNPETISDATPIELVANLECFFMRLFLLIAGFLLNFSSLKILYFSHFYATIRSTARSLALRLRGFAAIS
jgi:hypothetical protein